MNCLMNFRGLLFVLLIACLGVASCNKRAGAPKVLIFSKTAGYHHESIADGIAAIQKMGADNGFEVDTTTNAENVNEENLGQYAAVIFLSTTGDVLNHYQEADFERYIQAGGAYVGIHAAADTEYEWGWYNRLAGGYFANHPGMGDPHPNVQPGVLTVVDSLHPSTEFLPTTWKRTDEWYSYKKFYPEVKVLITLDEDSYQGGIDMGEHPIAWYHDFDGGRAWYTGGGHTKESYSEELFLKHILKGIKYAIGDNLKLDYKKAKTKRAPEENRFSKTTLSTGAFTEPTEMTILPNLDILVAQRRGEILHFDHETQALQEVAKLDVYWKTEVKDVNAEEGLMGLQKDPDFDKNGYVFAFYAPADTSVNRLSRFTFKNNKWDMDSEKIILEFYSQRQICCHTGGSIAFDKNGLLYLSTGDNSTPFNQTNSKYSLSGYAPLDQRIGREQWNALRTSGNANDLRGKVLRIKVKEDGSYDIPEGNLYPSGTAGTKPEIYVQGNRNPYRISIDQKNGFLYWGEVGPDANIDSLDTRGPQGYDEVNQARKAGNFGWPMFIGDNYAYHAFDFTNGTSGAAFDPSKPVNTSPANTGIQQLPPSQPAFIWYPYDASADFPSVGTGGRNAMAGPVYYPDLYPEATRFPDYYEGKLFIYDWIRGWIKAVTMTESGDFDKMEPFMENTTFNSPIDMEMGPDGRMYILEYGTGWFSQNTDSGLSRIDYNGGNRAPVVDELIADKTSGRVPLTVTLRATATDAEKDAMQYTWDLGNGETKTTDEPVLTHTFTAIGEYEIKVTATDPAGLASNSSMLSVYAGNIAPQVSIAIKGNQTFYFPGKQVAYEVSVNDEDDPEASKDLSTLFVSADYLEGLDKAEAGMGHQIMSEAMKGKSLISSMTCRACHKETEASIGPSYVKIAEKYGEKDMTYLINKVHTGGGGVWGETVMPANPDLKTSDCKALISYILSLDPKGAKPSLPASGTLKPGLGKNISANGVLVLNASYVDKGGKKIKPLSGSSTLALSNNSMDFKQATDLQAYSTLNFSGLNLLLVPNSSGHFALPELDLTEVNSIVLGIGSQELVTKSFIFEIRLDKPDGLKIGEGTFRQTPPPANHKGPILGTFSVPIKAVSDEKMHTLYIVSKPEKAEGGAALALSTITFKPK